jgi:hypothetical protein
VANLKKLLNPIKELIYLFFAQDRLIKQFTPTKIKQLAHTPNSAAVD